jgi:hypothetical protein
MRRPYASDKNFGGDREPGLDTEQTRAKKEGDLRYAATTNR